MNFFPFSVLTHYPLQVLLTSSSSIFESFSLPNFSVFLTTLFNSPPYYPLQIVLIVKETFHLLREATYD